MKRSFYSIIFENNDFIIINKESGISVIPERWADAFNIKEELERDLKQTVYTVHRIDKVTSGIVIFAKTQEMHTYLNGLFENKTIHKNYLALVEGYFGYDDFKADYPLSEGKKGRMVVEKKGKESITLFKLKERFKDYTLIEASPLTGRTHQIRVHLSFMGTPVLCDHLYGSTQELFLSSLKKKNFKLGRGKVETPLIARTALHAYELSFEDPSGKEWNFQAALPKDFKATLNQLRKYNKPMEDIFFG